MANRFQKLLFNLSTVSPLAFFMAIVWWLQCGAREITTTTGEIHLSAKSIIISIVGILGLLYAFRSILIVRIANKKLETVTIGVNSVKSKGNFPIIAIISYVLPFSNLVFGDYNIWFSLSIIAVAMIFLALSNTVWLNPILMLWRYHFYEISNTNGSEELPMISKRKSIQDAKSIKKVITLWDYFMIEVKE